MAARARRRGTVEHVARIPFQKLAPYGFVPRWGEKENLSAVCDVMLKKAFVYVENLTWVQQRPNNTIANSAAEHVCRKRKIVNCGAVGFTLQLGAAADGSRRTEGVGIRTGLGMSGEWMCAHA